MRKQVRIICASRLFHQQYASSLLLHYLVDAALEGRTITGSEIAKDVLGKDETFDPKGEPNLRVAISRLRARLMEYYKSSKAHDLVSIHLGDGYIPIFEYKRSDSNIAAPRSAEDRLSNTTPAVIDDTLDQAITSGGASEVESPSTQKPHEIGLPPLPANYQDRPEEIRALRDALLSADGGRRAIALTALEGMGGIGKTTLANALCRDELVRRTFPDGILWIPVGLELAHDTVARQRHIRRALDGIIPEREEAATCQSLYRALIANKAVLIVIDDVWSTSDLDPLLVESPRSRFLFTTRQRNIATMSGAREYDLNLLSETESLTLLTTWADWNKDRPPKEAIEIIHQCSCLPLAISIVGAMLRKAAPEEWGDVLDLLRNADLKRLHERLPEGQESFYAAIDISVARLAPQMKEKYFQLGVLPEKMSSPLPLLRGLWGCSEVEARATIRYLADRSLLQDRDCSVSLHDLQLSYLRAQWSDRQSLEVIRSSLRLSSEVIARDSLQSTSQITARLLDYQHIPAVSDLSKKMVIGAPSVWVRLRYPALEPPGTSLIRRMEPTPTRCVGLAVCLNGRYLLAASDHVLNVWDLETGRLNRSMDSLCCIRNMALTEDGCTAIVPCYDFIVQIWNLNTGKVLGETRDCGDVRCVAVTPNGRWAVCGCGSGGTCISRDRPPLGQYCVSVVDLETGKRLRMLEGHSDEVGAVALTPGGKQIVSASDDKTVKVWEFDTGQLLRTLEGHSSRVVGVAVTRDGRIAVSASADNTLKVWELNTGQVLHTLKSGPPGPNSVLVTPNGRWAISPSGKDLNVWDLNTGERVNTITGHYEYIDAVALTPDGERAISAADDALNVSDLKTRSPFRTQKRHDADVKGIAVSVNKRRAVSISWEDCLLWDLDTGRAIRTIRRKRDWWEAVAATPDGLVVCASREWLEVWNVDGHQEPRILIEGNLTDFNRPTLDAVAVSRDGRHALTAGRGVTIWDLTTANVVRKLENHRVDSCWYGITDVALTVDGGFVVSGSDNETVEIWNWETGEMLHRLVGHSKAVAGVAVSPDGSSVVSASYDKTLRVWDLKSGHLLRVLEGHASAVNCVAVSPDGRLILSGSRDHTLRIWNRVTGEVVTSFFCDAEVSSCVFSAPHEIIAGDCAGRIYFLSLEHGER